MYNQKYDKISYNRRLIKDPVYALITVVHELCHVKHSNHSPEFWRFMRWTPGIDYFTSNEQLAIEKCLKIYGYGNRLFHINASSI